MHWRLTLGTCATVSMATALGAFYRVLYAGVCVCVPRVGSLYAPITPHWKVLRSCNLHHSAPLEMLFLMVSTLTKVKIFRFWPKTMDYNSFDQFLFYSKLFTGRCYEAEICAILLLSRSPFRWYPCFLNSVRSFFGPKPWTIIRRFG